MKLSNTIPEPETVRTTTTEAEAGSAVKSPWEGRIARNIRAREFFVWWFVALAIGVWSLHRVGFQLANDSYQYLSVAENVRDHRAFATSLVHFDVERSTRQLPAPEVTFPAGYSVAIWATSSVFHCSMETAAGSLSFASLMLVMPLLWYGTDLLRVGSAITRILLALWAFSSPVQEFATTVSSDALFTTVTFTGIVLFAKEEGHGSSQPASVWRSAVAALLIGTAYWVRYAAVLLIAGLAVYAAVRTLYDRRLRPALAFSVCFSLLPPSLYMLRNRLVTYAWTGDHTTLDFSTSIPFFFRETASAAYRLAIGNVMPRGAVIELIVIAVALTGLVWIWATGRGGRKPRRIDLPSETYARSLFLLIIVGVYCAGIIFLALTTKISYGSRMFLPVLPEMMLLAGVGSQILLDSIARERKRTAYAMVLVALVAYCSVHTRALLMPVPPAEHRKLAQAFALPTAAGMPLSSWVANKIAPSDPVMAADGQATGYLLHRRTISLVGREYSRTTWSEPVIHQTMQTFGIKYLFLYPNAPSNVVPAEYESPFLSGLMNGRTPGWLKLTAANSRVEVFELQP